MRGHQRNRVFLAIAALLVAGCGVERRTYHPGEPAIPVVSGPTDIARFGLHSAACLGERDAVTLALASGEDINGRAARERVGHSPANHPRRRPTRESPEHPY